MNKMVSAILITAVAAMTLGSAGVVHAQVPTPQAPVPASGFGYGNMGAGSGSMHMVQDLINGKGNGLLHEMIIATFAEELGIPVDELEARLAAGERLVNVALSKGLTITQFRALMTSARIKAIDQAVLDGKLTQEQADRMKQRVNRHRMVKGNQPGGRGSGPQGPGKPGCQFSPQNNP
jgi:hypothetical protein